MSEYLTEQEQIQQLKTWVKQYGLTVLAGIVIAIIIISGWQYWQHYRYRTLTHASAVYDEMLAMRAQNNTKETQVQANKLISHYPRTPYSVMAALMLSRQATIEKNYPEAIKQLTWAQDHTHNTSIKEIANIRIARIFIAEQRYQEALDTLNTTANDSQFSGMINEARGDAYVALHDTASARKAYERALKEIPNADVSRPILQMKFANVATTTDTIH